MTTPARQILPASDAKAATAVRAGASSSRTAGPRLAPTPARGSEAPSSSRAWVDLRATAGHSALLLELQAATLARRGFEAAAMSFCSALARMLGASRVSLGMLEGRHHHVVATSGADRARLDTDVRAQLCAAMDEACDQCGTVAAPAGVRSRRITRAARALLRDHHGMVVSVPMAVDNLVVGAVVVEASDLANPIALVAGFCEDATALFAPVLHVLQQNERSPWCRLRDALRSSRAWWSAPVQRPWRWLAGGFLALLIAGCVIPLQVTIGAPARVEGRVQRVVAAPAAGFVKSALVRPGDAVKEGQLLAELLDRDLQLDRSRYGSEAAQHENAYAAAMARADRAEMMIHQAKLAEATAQLGLVDQQLARIQMRAPIDGVVIQGDLSQMLGAPVEKGQSLMTVAPAGAFRVIVELDERDIALARAGQMGQLSLSALPWHSTTIRIERITPMATVVDAHNVFELEASLSGPIADLRPGLRGVVRLEVGNAPPLPMWGRRLLEHVVRLAWRWMP